MSTFTRLNITSTRTVQATPTMTATAVPAEPAPQPLQHALYLYDGDGTMVKGIVNNTITYYPGRHYNKEVTGAITKVQKFYFAATLTLAVRTIVNNTDTLQWIVSDHLGSASTTANLDGTWNSTIQYTAFGEIRLTQGVTPTKYRYTGQLAQAELGLDYYVARWYDPYLNHWVQPDSTIPDPSKARSFDRYAYVNYSPIMFNDPYGHDVGCAGTDASNCRGMNNVIDRNLGYKVQTPSYLETKAQKRTPYSPYMLGWTYFDTAWSIYTNANSSIGDRYFAANYISSWVGAHVSLTVGLTGIGCVVAGPACVKAVEGSLGIGGTSSVLSQNSDFFIGTYNQLKPLFRGTEFQIHHLFEQRFFDVGLLQNIIKEQISIVVTASQHQVFTNAWRNVIGYSNSSNTWTTINATPEIILEAAYRIYAPYPEIMQILKQIQFTQK